MIIVPDFDAEGKESPTEVTPRGPALRAGLDLGGLARLE
jgi:hypothetical protein